MNEPNGPFLEFSFYKSKIDSSDFFSKLARALINVGAKYSGLIRYFDEVSRSKCISSITDYAMKEKQVDTSEVRFFLEDGSIKVVQIFFEGIVGFNKNSYDILTYQYVSRDSLLEEQVLVSIWIDGGKYFQSSGRQLRDFNNRLKSVFVKIVEEIEPDYAVVTDESFPLETPVDLKMHGSSLAFQNCFISDSFMSEDKINQVLNKFDVNSERSSKGVFIYGGWSDTNNGEKISEELSIAIAE